MSSDENNSNPISHNSRTNDNHIYLHITLSEADTNFDTRSISPDGGVLFSVTNCEISDMTHKGGNTFSVKITPDSGGNPLQCEFSLKSNSFMDRHQNSGPPSAGFSWIWKHDNVAPTVTFTFDDNTTTHAYIASGPVAGKLEFSENVTGVQLTTVKEIGAGGRASLGPQVDNIGGSGQSWTWDITPDPATNAMGARNLVFEYQAAGVIDAAGWNVTSLPGTINVEYGDPVAITMLFDNGLTSITSTTPKIVFDMQEAYSSNPDITIATSGLTSGINKGGAGGFLYHHTIIGMDSSAPNSGSTTISYVVGSGVATSGKYISPPADITWIWDQTLTPTFLFEDPNGSGNIGALSTINYNYPKVIVDWTVAVTGYSISNIQFGAPASVQSFGDGLLIGTTRYYYLCLLYTSPSPRDRG